MFLTETVTAKVRQHALIPAGRGRQREVGGDSAPLESDPDGTREVLVPDCQTITRPRAPFHMTPPAAAPGHSRASLETQQRTQQRRDGRAWAAGDPAGPEVEWLVRKRE